MTMIIAPRHCRAFTGALRDAQDFRAPLERRAPMKAFFQRDGISVDSWTLGPKPLCHRHPTGPHPSGLPWTPWTPAKGESTRSDFALVRQNLHPSPDRLMRLLPVGVALVEVGHTHPHLRRHRHPDRHVA